jgi:hypothetical protein
LPGDLVSRARAYQAELARRGLRFAGTAADLELARAMLASGVAPEAAYSYLLEYGLISPETLAGHAAALDLPADSYAAGIVAAALRVRQGEKGVLPLSPNGLTFDQELARADILAGRNVFLAGDAGAGKTHLVEAVQEEGDFVVLAPTGVAALRAGGMTIHRFFGFPMGIIQDPGAFDARRWLDRHDWARPRKLIVDEVSMVRSDVFTAMDKALRSVARATGAEAAAGRPFGGAQVVAVGDFAQLPPVVTREERPVLTRLYGGPFAFDTPSWDELGFSKHHLRTQCRQGGGRFVAVLDAIRNRDVSVLPELNARVGAIPEDATILCARNDDARAVNLRKLAQVEGPSRAFAAEKRGEPVGEPPAEESLEVRKGMRVLLVVNRPGLGFVNGDTGTVLGMGLASLDEERGEEPVIRVALDRGRTVNVPRHSWERRRYVSNDVEVPVEGEDGELAVETQPVLKSEVVGVFCQFPVKYGWAVTIHKSQGMSLPRVGVDLGRGAWDHGQVYVALSRATSMEGLFLSRPLRPEEIVVHDRVLDFMKEEENKDSSKKETQAGIRP